MDASKLPSVSVIIPTYNRQDSLLRALDSLRPQTYPRDHYEVIVVDDGSTDGTGNLAWNAFPFRVRCLRQENAGATKARNAGAAASSAEVLVFMDDDIVATPGMLEYLVDQVSTHERTIVLATLIPALDGATNPFAALYSSGAVFPRDVDLVHAPVCSGPGSEPDGCFVHFTKCKTGVLAIKRRDFQALDMFQDPTGGWPNWDDVDFGYRAHMQGFRLWRSHRAGAYHHDRSLQSLESAGERWERASRSAAWLFKRHPELAQHIPSLCDKGPLSFSTDSPGLVARKAGRRLVSSPPCVSVMRWLTRVLEKHRPDSFMLALLYRWLISAYIYRGYRRGLREVAAKTAAMPLARRSS